MTVGVVVVTYNAGEIILDCLESLLASKGVDLRVVVVDNASGDDTIKIIENWAEDPTGWVQPDSGHFTAASHDPVTLVSGIPDGGNSEIALIRSSVNKGFAGGVNIGLRLLQADPEIEYFWVLNPDCTTENLTASRMVDYAGEVGSFSIMTGRIFYKTPALMIQSDGGYINFLTGICTPYNLGKTGRDIPAPADADLDYISGSHMFVSRLFLDRTGLMPEEYFLYYEEIDWCCRRGDLPMLICPGAVVHHDGGHSLGSARLDRGPSQVASYFMGRSRMKFIRRHKPLGLPLAFAYSLAKVIKFLLKGQTEPALAMLRGISGMEPPRAVKEGFNPRFRAD